MSFNLIFHLPVLFMLAAVYATCPSGDDVSPCSCIQEYDYIEVECQGEEISLDQLKTVLKAIHKDDKVLLVLNEINLGSLPSKFFEGFNIFKIEIERCKLESLSSASGKPFSGLESTLTGLDIVATLNEDNLKTKLELSHLKGLEDLHLFDNTITEVGNDWFSQGPVSLIRLVFSNNGIQNLGDRAFEKLEKLNILTFEGNRLGSISRSMLPTSADVLEELDLDNNGLMSVPEDLFSNMPDLKKLSLQSNGILKIEENTFRPIWEQLAMIDLRENPLICDSHINWLTTLKKPEHVLGKCQTPHERRDLELEKLIEQ